jgi:SUN domain-containing protein 1/2
MQIELDKFAEKNGFNKPLNLGHLISPSKPNKVKASSKRKNVLSVSGVQSIIDERLEIARADVTGKHDFASLRSGASVIYTGSRQTSPSLVQNLPLGNQVMAKLGLRFYGHGPDAALEPTFPRDSLGQCWSFEKEGERSQITIKEWTGDDEEFENEPDRGMYATLAVKLANPIYVKTVSIEHAPLAVSKNRSTAIRKFRAIGFQSFDASGEPWLLGTFEYDSSKDEYLQEFDVQTKLENGLSVPRMGSIVLAIDSNWGADYSCLYRFRVNGQTRS